jgi:uncharacterized membrane protein YqjE
VAHVKVAPVMESTGENSSGSNGAAAADQPDDTGPARALTLHLLRMLETRMDAAGIALDNEIQSITSRVQLKLLAAGAVFFAIWGGIVLLAIALPEPARIPVLAGVIVAFVIAAIWAQLAAKRRAGSHDVGSMRWFLDGLKRDLEVLSRSLAPRHEPVDKRSPPNDLAA